MMLDKFILNQIITHENIVTHFQPIVSIKDRTICGVEALTRGISNDNTLIPPSDLFETSENLGLSAKLDNVCQKKALQKFYECCNSSMLLFLNLDISQIDKGTLGVSNSILSLASLLRVSAQYNIPHENIVIEILESKLENTEKLIEIIEVYRSHGFLIALDDFGIGHSNFDRMSILKPDIVKIDRSLITNIDKNSYKQEIFKSITGLARKIGALVIAEGVETREETFKCIELRADLLQGFYISKPGEKMCKTVLPFLNNLYLDFKCYLNEKLNTYKTKTDLIIAKAENIISSILMSDNIENELEKIALNSDFMEAMYLLDMNGRQISFTHLSANTKPKLKSLLFSPSTIDDDHSLKQYYYKIKTGETPFFITEPYISRATGNMCKTISSFLNGKSILCIDIPVKHEYFEEFIN